MMAIYSACPKREALRNHFHHNALLFGVHFDGFGGLLVPVAAEMQQAVDDAAQQFLLQRTAMERGVFYHCKHVKDTPGGFTATTNVTRVIGKGQQVLLQHFQRKHASAGEIAA